MNKYYILLFFIYIENIFCQNLVSCLNNCSISNCGIIDISTNICYGCLDKSKCNGCSTTYLYNNTCMNICPQGLTSREDVFGWHCIGELLNSTVSENNPITKTNTIITKYLTYTPTCEFLNNNKINIDSSNSIFDTKMIVIIVENSVFVILIIIIAIIKICGCINKNKNKENIYEKRLNMKENDIRNLKNEIYELKTTKKNDE